MNTSEYKAKRNTSETLWLKFHQWGQIQRLNSKVNTEGQVGENIRIFDALKLLKILILRLLFNHKVLAGV